MSIECKNCGDTGYTLEVDAELGEIVVRCDTCWWVEQDQLHRKSREYAWNSERGVWSNLKAMFIGQEIEW